MGSIDISSASYGMDQHYETLSTPVIGAPPVAMFFSFVDPKSYEWALKHQVVQNIRRSLPANSQTERFHVSLRWTWNLGEALNHSWAIAKDLQVDDRVVGPLFEAVLIERRVTDLEGIKAVFESVGVTKQMFDRAWGKSTVLQETRRTEEMVQKINIKTAPCIVVRGKYVVKTDVLGKEVDVDEVIAIVKELLSRD